MAGRELWTLFLVCVCARWLWPSLLLVGAVRGLFWRTTCAPRPRYRLRHTAPPARGAMRPSQLLPTGAKGREPFSFFSCSLSCHFSSRGREGVRSLSPPKRRPSLRQHIVDVNFGMQVAAGRRQRRWLESPSSSWSLTAVCGGGGDDSRLRDGRRRRCGWRLWRFRSAFAGGGGGGGGGGRRRLCCGRRGRGVGGWRRWWSLPRLFFFLAALCIEKSARASSVGGGTLPPQVITAFSK